VITFSLQSGSNGNAIYVETADAKLLIDCGLTGKKAFERMAVHDRDARELTAVLVSHDHRDHVRGVGVLARRCRIPIFATGGTWEVLPRKGVGLIPDRRSFVAGDTLLFGETRVETIPTPHDGEDGVAFVVEAEGRRLGVIRDDAARTETTFDGLRGAGWAWRASSRGEDGGAGGAPSPSRLGWSGKRAFWAGTGPGRGRITLMGRLAGGAGRYL
jgi:phosphoribosyl 1,2-cyclic phosphodiesterase